MQPPFVFAATQKLLRTILPNLLFARTLPLTLSDYIEGYYLLRTRYR